MTNHTLDRTLDADERRFLHELDASIALASTVLSDPFDDNFHPGIQIRETINILCYFARKVEQDETPDIRVIQFVSHILIKGKTEPQLYRAKRNDSIKRVIKAELKSKNTLRPSVKNGDNAAYKAATAHKKTNNKPLNEDTCINIYYEKKPPFLILKKVIDDGSTPDLPLLKSCLDDVRESISRLLDASATGESFRNRLDLYGYGWWNEPIASHEEIVQDVEQLISQGLAITSARKVVAKRLGLTIAHVTKTHQRKKKTTTFNTSP